MTWVRHQRANARRFVAFFGILAAARAGSKEERRVGWVCAGNMDKGEGRRVVHFGGLGTEEDEAFGRTN